MKYKGRPIAETTMVRGSIYHLRINIGRFQRIYRSRYFDDPSVKVDR